MDKNHDYISRILAKSQFTGIFQDTYPTAKIHDLIDTVPAEDVQPVVHGMWLSREYICGDPNTGIEDEWIEHPAKQSNNYAYCSVCKEKAGYDWEQNLILSDYCPNCGAKMDLDNNKKIKEKEKEIKNMFEMKSCPFCNSFNFTCNVSLNGHKRATGLKVNCLDCGTTFILEEPVYSYLNFERYDAIDVWNGRERKNG